MFLRTFILASTFDLSWPSMALSSASVRPEKFGGGIGGGGKFKNGGGGKFKSGGGGKNGIGGRKCGGTVVAAGRPLLVAAVGGAPAVGGGC